MGADDISLKGRVYSMISDQLCVDINKITDKSRLVEDLGVSCGDMIELCRRIKKEFGVKISGKDAEKISTVGELASRIRELLRMR